MSPSSRPSSSPSAPSAPARSYRREIRFLVTFVVLLGGGFTLLSLNAANDHFVVPFTAAIARASGFLLDLLGQDVDMVGTQIHGSSFAVDIKNGCNGLETVIIFVAAILSFPSSWRSRGIGLALGVIAIQAVNLVRVVALFLTGTYLPAAFDSSHTVVWQTLVIVFGVLLWIFWANRYATVRPANQATG